MTYSEAFEAYLVLRAVRWDADLAAAKAAGTPAAGALKAAAAAARSRESAALRYCTELVPVSAAR